MTPHTGKDYSRWGEQQHHHETMEGFRAALSEGQATGVHTVSTGDGETLDLLVAGNPGQDGRAIPVFFNGAVPAREEKTGPFFSGGRVGFAVSSGYLGISDPCVDRDPKISLAWYAGYEGLTTRDVILAALEAIASVYQRELVLVGGSGGGFAALYYASRLTCDVSVFVWNPQTDILAYNRTFVDAYLTRAFPAHIRPAQDPAQWLAQRTVETSTANLHRSLVTADHHNPRTIRRLLILQNVSDWHLAAHTVPYLTAHEFISLGTGSFVLSPNHCIQISDWGEGHAPLPTELVVDHLKRYLDPDQMALDTGRKVALDDRCDDSVVSRAPIDLRPLIPDFREQWSAVADVATGVVNITSGSINPGYGGLRFGLIQTADNAREQLAWFLPEARINFSPQKLWPGAELMVVARDGLNHHLLHIPVEQRAHDKDAKSTNGDTSIPSAGDALGIVENLSQLSSSPFIYGSCVTRDAFALLERPNVAEYVARSPILSAMSAPVTALPQGMEIDAIDSAFQRRMVTWDSEKSLPGLLSSTSHDAVIIDLIDERLNLLDLGDESVLTVSTEAVKAGLTRQAGTLLSVGDPNFLSRWDAAAQRLIALLQNERVILNRVFWAAEDQDGNDLTQKFAVTLNNQVLEHMYRTLEEGLDCVVIDYPAELLVADSNHRWGLSPFHFTRDFYLYFLQQVRAILDNQ